MACSATTVWTYPLSPDTRIQREKGKFFMKRVLPLAALLLIFPTLALAQSDDYKKWEFFGGYSALNFDNLGNDTDIAALNDVLSQKNTLRGSAVWITTYRIFLAVSKSRTTTKMGQYSSPLHTLCSAWLIKGSALTASKYRPSSASVIFVLMKPA